MPGFDTWGRTLIIVTGASRGFGSALCEEVSKHVAPGSLIVGLARSLTGLEESKRKVQKINSNVEYTSKTVDLRNISNSEIKSMLDEICSCHRVYDRAILIHNAGTLGDLDYLRNIDDAPKIEDYFNMNISSLIPLTTYFLRYVRSMYLNAKIHIINISSLAAIQAFKSWGLYCAAKAARDMIFKVLSQEETEIDVLSYAPGPLDNDMQEEIRSSNCDPGVKQTFICMKEEGKLVAMATSAAQLMKLLEKGSYKSGDHVDFYDQL